jgi:hypothetical protein
MSNFTGLHKELATPIQVSYMDAIEKHGSMRKAAEALGKNSSSVSRSIKALNAAVAKRGLSPEHDMQHAVPDGYAVKGTSTLYKDGKPALQWVKTSIDRERQYELMREAIDVLCHDVVPVKAAKSKAVHLTDMLAVYPLGDPHIGMLSWGEETGEDWDLEIAEAAYADCFARLIQAAPQCHQALIVNLGDYFHYDNMEGVTTRSGHALDVDSRYAKMIKTGVRIMRRMITQALDHHGTVKVINATGNHDDTSALFLNVALANIYENEPRVVIEDSPTPIHYHQFGQNMLAVHHGHTIKMKDMASVMACDEPQMWGNTAHRWALTGHIHHDRRVEYPGCTSESFRTMAAKDAYAAWNGYRAKQDSKAIVLHPEYGEVERHTVNIGMIR